ncbi:MAG: ABC transporter ATP-binding protein [Planctomycetes bacterium]|nr:ABC transporter ATP-binding protein [Planctomycetota bacterium]
MLSGAFSEILSLGSVIPFLGVLTAPDRLIKQPLISYFAACWGITSPKELLLPLTILFGVAALISGGLRLTLLWAINRFSFSAGADIGLEIYRRALYQPYKEQVARNSSTVISGITQKVGSTINSLLSMLNLANASVILLAITITLFVIDPVITTLAGLCLGISYIIIVQVFRRQLKCNSLRVSQEHTKVIKIVQEGLGGIRDVLLDGTQSIFCDAYRQSDLKLRQAQASNQFIALGPRYIMESLGMVLLAGLAYGISRKTGGMVSMVPVLGAIALGAQRLLPALQQCYASWAGIMGSYTQLAEVIGILDQPLSPDSYLPAFQPIGLQKDIRFDSVKFQYHNEGPVVLNGLDIVIPKGARVGIIGETGSGKSTAMDLLMGLLDPTDGRILVDGSPLEGQRRRAWQRTIAYVPQHIYLADASIAENIAFGVPREAIDLDAVRAAASRSQIANFIESSSKDGYWAMVGERGIRLSGGQRQRIGIARALYKQASVLVFDEATSAIDTITEEYVMDAIDKLDRDLTVVLIAHRLTTIRNCNQIVEIMNGRTIIYTSYEQLLENKLRVQRVFTS